MQLSVFTDRYPEAKKYKGYVDIYVGSAQLDIRCISADELIELGQLIKKIELDFENWFATILKIDPNLVQVNAFWHDFCAGKTPEESYKESGHYGKK